MHSSIRFDVVDTDSMMKSISGRFTDFEGTVEGGEEQSAQGVVRTPSVLTDNEMRDEHLRSNDLLGTDRYPEITFKSSRIEHVDGDRHKIFGDLTVKEAAIPVELDAKFQATGKDADGRREDALPRRGRDRVGPDARRDHRRHHRGACVTKILGISGSLRERSYNTALLRAAAELVPPDAEIELFDLAAIPLYNDDVESAGDPAPVAELRAAVAEADALLLATPEYNRGTSGVLKNAIDWLSRPALASVLRWKPVAIMGASSGRGGTRRAQQQVRDALLFPGAIVLEQPEVAVPIAWERFDPDLQLTDENIGAAVTELLAGLVELAHQHQLVAA